MKYSALFNRVAVKPDSPEEVTKGGIIIPDTVKDQKGFKGTVFSAGASCKVLKDNDRVYYNSRGGQSIKMKRENGETFEVFIFLEEEILGKITDEENEGIEGVDYELVVEEHEENEEISFIPKFANV